MLFRERGKDKGLKVIKKVIFLGDLGGGGQPEIAYFDDRPTLGGRKIQIKGTHTVDQIELFGTL